ncbi:MAG: radical SAM protein [Deltaproteobacteria bacterium]|nr:radical SAM protein [Deltaproteobacteria bacterium]
MRVALVHPAGSNWVPGQRDITSVANRMAPLGLLSIAAWLERDGHEVAVFDGLGPDAPRETGERVREILGFGPELVGFSATTSGFLDGNDLAVALKAAAPEVRIVFGGVHVSAVGQGLLERFPAIDFLCLGEGEVTMAELAAGREPATIDGLMGRDGERIFANAPRAPLAELDRLPFPAYAALRGFPRRYRLPLFSYVRTPGATMSTSRGCPYQCSYCDRSVFGRSHRVNSAEYIYDHMRHLRVRFGVRHINIYDDLFTLNRRRITALCGLLAARPLGVQFNCAVRVGHADDELLGMLKDAGCLMVSLGIESADPALLERHKAGVELDEVRSTVARIKAKGLRAKGLFMMGLPGETEESIRATSDFAMSLGLDDMNMTKFTPFPGAPIWKDLSEEGEFHEDWRLMNCLHFVFVPRTMASRERMDELYNWHVKRFYSDPAWRRTFRRRLWQHRGSLWYLLRHLPSFLAAKRHFEPGAAGAD